MKCLYFVLVLPLLLAVTLLMPRSALAVDPFEQACQGQAASSAVCQDANANRGSNPLVGPNGVFTKATRIIAALTGVASVIMVVVGGMRYVTSSGDAGSVKSARDTILYAVIGLIISVVAGGIISLVLSRI